MITNWLIRIVVTARGRFQLGLLLMISGIAAGAALAAIDQPGVPVRGWAIFFLIWALCAFPVGAIWTGVNIAASEHDDLEDSMDEWKEAKAAAKQSEQGDLSYADEGEAGG